MPKYNVSVKSSNYQVLSEPQKKYNVGVNYEIPSKYLQYGNEILNTSSWIFNGTNLGFPLIDADGDPYTPINDQQLIVAVNGLVQVPGIDYTVSGTNIIFTTPPTSGDTVYVEVSLQLLTSQEQLTLLLMLVPHLCLKVSRVK